MIRFVILLLVALTLLMTSACERTVVSRTGVSVDTRAYYTAYQKNPTSPWRQINFNNRSYTLETQSFTVDKPTDPYAVVFVCPSKRRDVPHQVFVYYATAAEMTLLDFGCKKPPADIVKKPLYGKIGGVTLADLEDPQAGELVHLALSSTDSLTALEAYAAKVPVGQRDVVAFKGKQIASANVVIKPEAFVIAREVSSLSEASERVDVAFGSALGGYSADFDPANESSVAITGVNAGEDFSAEVSFLSTNKSLLKLVQTKQQSFQFTPVPLDEFTGADLGGFFNSNEFYPGEGHELSVTVGSADGQIEREVRKFFTVSNAATHKLHLPRAIDFSPTLSLQSITQFQKMSMAWPEYEDIAAGKTQLYRWVFDGTAAQVSGEKQPDPIISQVRWYVHATPGWLNLVSETAGNLSLTLPVKYDVDVVRDGENVDVWPDDWSFRAATTVDWTFSVFSSDEQGDSGAIVEYLLNRNIVENYTFTQVYRRSSDSPP